EAALPDGDGLATRTRVRFAADEAGHLAMRRHRTHELLAVEACALGVPAIVQLRLGARTWTPGAEVEAISLDGAISPTVSVTTVERGTDRRAPSHRNESVLDEAGLARGQATTVLGEAFEVGAGVFWQVHRSAPALLVDVVLAGLELAVGDGVLDLYCGAGLFTRFAAIAVGETGSVVGVDASRAATSDARRNLAAYRWAKVVTAKVDRRSVERASDGCTHVVMDPPRRGADRGALAAVCEVRSIRRLVSVSCDPSTFARDLRVLLDAGWALRSVRAFDLFEMTEHLECIAVLER
ncbi:MAG TPA: methyltransferase domain-containing protein, partial [Acidimicrobiales bacterium]